MMWEPWWPPTAGGAAVDAAADGGPGAAAERFLRRMLGDRRWDALGPSQQAARRAEGAALVAELRSAYAGVPYVLGDVRCPVRAAMGSEAADHHRRAAEALALAVGQPGGADVVDGAGHGCHISHPAAFAAWAASLTAGS
jgi:pimeloyl-ACP methyl ester carboxylesterase